MAKRSAKCPQCGNRVELDAHAGPKVVCPQCQAHLTVNMRTPDKPPDPLIGQTLGELEIVDLLGRGGMGAVYKARQPSLDRMVAVKVLSKDHSRDTAYVGRFTREARAAAAVSHPNIIEIHSVGADRGHHYIAMEFIQGETLADVLRRDGPLPPDRAVEIMKQVAAALAEAHAAGIVHRDIKPSNILLTPRRGVKVADFGLAKRPDADVAITQAGKVLGTPLYMPPEVLSGQEFEHRSDLYSLGATFYHVLAGRPPFEGRTSSEIAVKQVKEEVPPLAQIAPNVPRALRRVIHRLLAKTPAERHRSAEDLLHDLQHIDTAPDGTLGELIDALEHPQPPTPTPQPPNRIPTAKKAEVPKALIAGIAAGMIAFVVVLLIVLVPKGDGTPQPPVKPTPPPPPVAARPWRIYTKWPFDAPEAKRRQAETAQALGAKAEQTIDLGKGVKLALVLIPAGEFLMGSPEKPSPQELVNLYGGDIGEYQREFPQHRVRITRPFRLGKYEVTQDQWQAVMGANLSKFKDRPRNPVESVSWEDCQGFVQKLGVKLQKTFRLPTEAEWEYACRAGTPTQSYFEDGQSAVADHAWFAPNSRGTSQPVGQKKPNAWGLHDMIGNVYEWCGDWFDEAYYAAGGNTVDPTGPASGSSRVLRGVSFRCAGTYCRSAFRYRRTPGSRFEHVGFRVVLPSVARGLPR